MKRYEVMYFFREGIRGVFLHGFTSFAAVSVIAACLLIMGSFSLIAVNIDRIIEELRNQNKILVVVNESLSRAEAQSIGTRINRTIDNIEELEFIPKETALENYREQLGEQGNILEGIEDERNPLRDRYLIQLHDVSLMRETIERLEGIAGVEFAAASFEVSEFILSTRSIVKAVSYTLIIMLLGVSVFIISNTVKLATFDRREEIGIMRVVGATYAFIRWPFVIEGFLLGLTGAALGFFLQWSVYSSLTRMVNGLIPSFNMSPFDDLMIIVLLLFTGFGFVVGVLGSVLTIRKFLRV
ncbi:MAG: permease-like cell division protein FtsX [Oscillospiraceae bacterium]|nr:permease-like cell division protein FtsX [Oscillospiraceae bacterium]